MRTILLSVLVSLFGSSAFAWTATYLQGGNWAITCANGTSWSYSGSSAGLDIVGPALCPSGISAPSNPIGFNISVGVLIGKSVDLVKNRREVGDRNNQTRRSYPPHGYPCLGCVPCPGNPTEFCDVNNTSRLLMQSAWVAPKRNQPDDID